MPRRHAGKRKWRSPDYSFSPLIAIPKSVSVIRAAFPFPTGKYSVLKIFCDPGAGTWIFPLTSSYNKASCNFDKRPSFQPVFVNKQFCKGHRSTDK
jgi:hypothetical protein